MDIETNDQLTLIFVFKNGLLSLNLTAGALWITGRPLLYRNEVNMITLLLNILFGMLITAGIIFVGLFMVVLIKSFFKSMKRKC